MTIIVIWEATGDSIWICLSFQYRPCLLCCLFPTWPSFLHLGILSGSLPITTFPNFDARIGFSTFFCNEDQLPLPPIPSVSPSFLSPSQRPSAFNLIKGYLSNGREPVALLTNND